MDIEEAVELLKSGQLSVFNAYRRYNPGWIPNFSGLDLTNCDLAGTSRVPANLDRAILFGTKLPTGEKFFRPESGFPSMNDALIDLKTSGFSLEKLQSFGAIYFSKDQVVKLMESDFTKIFISYAWANSDVVSAIDYWLRTKGLNTKIDKRDFFAGSRIREEILRIMKDSSIVLLFHSKESRDKPWIEFERELVGDLEMSAKQEGKTPPRIIYVVIDDTPLPGITEQNKIAIMAKGKRFELVCEEIYHHILKLPRNAETVDLLRWQEYVF